MQKAIYENIKITRHLSGENIEVDEYTNVRAYLDDLLAVAKDIFNKH